MTAARSDAENKRLLDAAMPTYEGLRRDIIREESNIERLEHELAEANKQVMAAYGTSNLEELERMLGEAQLKNSEATDRFRARVAKADNDVKSAGAKA